MVEIIDNEKKPRLTGGRRNAPTLQNGNNAVDTPLVPVAKLPATAGRKCGGAILQGTNAYNSNLVPVNRLPPSAGSLASVMATLKPKRGGAISAPEIQQIKNKVIAMQQSKGGKISKKGGKSLARMLADPEKNLPELVETINESPPAPYPEVVEGSGRRRGRPKKGGAVSAPDEMAWRRIGGKKMSKLVPQHGHGANTQIGTNYQLGQFGGAIQPIGTTTSTLSPALSTGSIGAGRKGIPNNKKVKEVLHLMVKGRRLLKGKGLMKDAWNALKEVATDLYHEFGPAIFEKGKEELIKFLREEAEKYILGHHLNGGGWFSVGIAQLGIGLVSMGKSIFKAIVELLGKEIVDNLKKEIVRLGVDLAKRKGEELLGLTEKNGKLEKKEETKEGSGMPDNVKQIIQSIAHEEANFCKSHHGYTRSQADAEINYIMNTFVNQLPDMYRDRMAERVRDDLYSRASGGGKFGDINAAYKAMKDWLVSHPIHTKDELKNWFVATFPNVDFRTIMRMVLSEKLKGKGRPGENGHGVRKIGGGAVEDFSNKIHAMAQKFLDFHANANPPYFPTKFEILKFKLDLGETGLSSSDVENVTNTCLDALRKWLDSLTKSGGKRKSRKPIIPPLLPFKKPIGGDPSTWTPKTGGKSSVDIQNLLEEMAFPQNRTKFYLFLGVTDLYGPNGQFVNDYSLADKKARIQGSYEQLFPGKGKYFNGNDDLFDWFLEDDAGEKRKEYDQAVADYDKAHGKSGSGRKGRKKGGDILPSNPTIQDVEDAYNKGLLTKAQKDFLEKQIEEKTKSGSGVKRNKARGAIVSDVMKKHKLSLPMASKYVKEHGLY